MKNIAMLSRCFDCQGAAVSANLANVHRHFWGFKIEVRLIIRVHRNIFVVYIRLTLLIGSYFQARVSFRYCKFISPYLAMASDSSCGSFENPLLNGSHISQWENEADPIGNDPESVATWMLNGSNIYDESKVNLIRVNFELRALKKEARFFQREMHYTYARMQMHFVCW
jgi:hypothetical protein